MLPSRLDDLIQGEEIDMESPQGEARMLHNVKSILSNYLKYIRRKVEATRARKAIEHVSSNKFFIFVLSLSLSENFVPFFENCHCWLVCGML